MSYTAPTGNAVSILFGRAPNAAVPPVTIVFGAPTGASNLSLSQQLEAPMQLGAIAAVAKLTAAQALPSGTQDARLGFVALSLMLDQVDPQTLQDARLAASAVLSGNQDLRPTAQDVRLGLLSNLSLQQINEASTQSGAIKALSGLHLEQSSGAATAGSLSALAGLTLSQTLLGAGTFGRLKPSFQLQVTGRTREIKAQPRLMTVLGDIRQQDVNAENRGFRVIAESRACIVYPESRRVRVLRQGRKLALDSKEN